MNSDKKEYRLSVKSTGIMSELAYLTIMNGFMEVIDQNYAVLEKTLPEGIYKVTLKLNEQVLERMIMLNQDVDEEIPTPEIYSSVVSQGFTSSHEDYSRNAVAISKQATVVLNKNKKGTGSIFIFFRYPDNSDLSRESSKGESLGKGFSLLDADRKLLCRLEGNEVKEDLNAGWIGFNAYVEPGGYYLYYAGRDKEQLAREIPLTVYKGWQLQLFCTSLNGPQFPSLKIMVSSVKEGFSVDDADNYIIDGILQKMHNGIYFMPKSTFLSLINNKWQQPVKGLLAAYIYYLNKDETEYELPHDTIDRLSELLGKDAPDIKALKILRASHDHTAIPEVRMDRPCLFLAGMKAAISKAIEFPEKHIILENSIVEDIVDKLYTDMVWTSYLPISEPKTNEETLEADTTYKGAFLKNIIPEINLHASFGKTMAFDNENFGFDLPLGSGSSSGSDFGGGTGRGRPESKRGKPKVERPEILNSTLAESILYFVDRSFDNMSKIEGVRSGNIEEGLSVNGLSKALNVTQNMVQNTINEIVRDKENIVSYGNQAKKSELNKVFSMENIDKLNDIY
ncbi:hypothetical protein OQX61_23875 [Pedobacter sp. PLR]|uniref:hypothetical protein n=1 Tax=Pedobacter sp. PLR TaxID=2994465 RepID=UPI0022454247|nr:hypothetical protein [Pedobacter sp. PLR]MCX2454330.1 hypothetical protein [Pedobacter sp. PLR]